MGSFGFGNGTWDCGGWLDCAKYYALPLHLRAGCAKWRWSPLESYLSTNFHDVPAEWMWIASLVSSGAVDTPCGADRQ